MLSRRSLLALCVSTQTSLASRELDEPCLPLDAQYRCSHLFSLAVGNALPRLALLKEFPPDTGIMAPTALAGYQKETLKLLGLLDRVRHSPEKHLFVENYYFSAPTAMISTYNPYGVA